MSGHLAEKGGAMTPRLTTILLATDGSPTAAEAGRAAVALARSTGAALHVVHVWQIPTEYAPRSVGAIDHAYIAAIHEEHGGRGGTAPGPTGDRGARRGRHRRGYGPAKRVLLGSVAEGIARGAACPVLTVRGEGGAWPPARVIVGDDGSAASRRAAELATMIAAAVRADLLLIRAVPPLPPAFDPTAPADDRAARLQAGALRGAEAGLAERAATLTALFGRPPRMRATVEDADIALLREADEGTGPALIAVGTRGTAPAGQLWLGSTALRVLACAEGSVLICPHQAEGGTA